MNCNFGLRSLDLPGQVLDPEEAVYVDAAAIMDVISAHVRQARCRQIDSGADHHPVLDRNVVEMVIFDIRGRFDLDQPPALVLAALEYIDSDENVPVLECALEDRWNLRIVDQFPSRPDRLFSISGLNDDATRIHLLRQQTDLLPLVNDRLLRIIRLHRHFRRVHSQIQALETLRPGDEFGFGEERQY